MSIQVDVRAAEMARALRIKCHNAFTAILTGLALASLAFLVYSELRYRCCLWF